MTGPAGRVPGSSGGTGGTGSPDRCAPAAEERGDQLAGTTPPVTRWLLVEQPGSWGRDALRESALDPVVAARLASRAARARVRVVLIRRPGRATPDRDRAWAYVDSRPGHAGSWWGTWAAATDLLDVPLDRPPAGPPSPAPTYLVCAHGKHDACCAMRGRPVAAALAAARPGAVWECSHVGGDRFAANLVMLPHGFYYGHVTPSVAVGLVAGYEAGTVDPTWLRGRSSLPAPVQAAQHYARRQLDERAVDALAPLATHALGDTAWRVDLAAAGGPVRVVVRAGTAPAALLTCSARHPDHARTFELVELNRTQPVTPADLDAGQPGQVRSSVPPR